MNIVATLRRSALVGLISGAALVSINTPAHAASLNLLNSNTCDSAALSQPFASYGDSNSYKLVSGGDFTTGAAGWTLTGGAAVVAANTPESPDALQLPAGATALSPATCVDPTDPTMRMFAQSLTNDASVLVAVVYSADGKTISVPVGTISQDSSWQPTNTMQTGSALASLLNGGIANMSVSFTSISGNTDISDVFVDPRMSY